MLDIPTTNPSAPPASNAHASTHAGVKTAVGEAQSISLPATPISEEAASTKRQRFSRWLGFGLRQTFFCFMTDFIDPIAGEKFQKAFDPGGVVHRLYEKQSPERQAKLLAEGKYSWLTKNGTVAEAQLNAAKEEAASPELNDYLSKTGQNPDAAKIIGQDIFGEQFGQKEQPWWKGSSLRQQVWIGEIAGDLSAVFIYLGVKSLFEKPLDRIIEKVKGKHDQEYTHRGQKDIDAWAREHGIEKDDPRYAKRMEEFKHYQAESKVDSAIIAGAATVTNVLIQKAMGNERPWLVVLGGKLIGSGLTFAVMSGFSRYLPQTAQTLDEEADRRYFSRTVRWVQRTFGLTETKEMHEARQDLDQKLETAPLPAITLTKEERERLNTKPKTDFRERSFASQQVEANAQMMI